MRTFIVLLKGINVGGHKKVAMAELRNLLNVKGYEAVQTYIQSGNIVLQSSQTKREIEKTLEEAILSYFGFEVSVLTLSHQDLQMIFDHCPFNEVKKKASYFMMLHDNPDPDALKIALEKTYEGEEYHIINKCIYYYSSKGFGQSKFNVNFFERKFKTFATARNYNTMVKLLSLSAE